MKKIFALTIGFCLFTMIAGIAGPVVSYTWTGSSDGNLLLDANWSPTGVPGSESTVSFDENATTTDSLTPYGEPFTVKSATFAGAAFTFDIAGGGDSIYLGNGTTGGITVSSAASVDFSDQPIMLNNSMTWAVSGGSSLSSAGTIDTTEGLTITGYSLTLSFGVAQTNNIAQFQDFEFGTTGSLTIANWGGTLGQFGGVNNHVRFGIDPSGYLGNISFTGYAGSVAAQDAGSYWEVVPVPEPATISLMLAGLAGLVGIRRRA